MQLDSIIRPLRLRMMSTTLDSITSNDDHPIEPQLTHEKFKASNFPIMSIKIGSWEKYSRYQGELVGKYYYAKKKMVWEFLDGALKNKIEIRFSDIDAMRAIINENQPETLEILVNRHPLFFRETNPVPKKHTIWQNSSDFTGGQALSFRKHCLKFLPGTLDRHYAKLLQSDSRLLNISQKPFPNMYFPYFQSRNINAPNMSFGYGISPQMVHQNSTPMHSTQSPNIGMQYQPRNNVVSSNNFGQTIAPYYQSMNGAPTNEKMQSMPTMLPMNGQMQSMPTMLPMNGQMQSIPTMLPMNGQIQSMSTMLPMNGQMQSMPTVLPTTNRQMRSMPNVEENVQLPESVDHEMNEILRNIEQHLLGD